MEFTRGKLYFISDDLFEIASDPYLKRDHEDTKRPHYFVLRDKKTGLFWVVPCSSKADKYQRIIDQRIAYNKEVDTIKIVDIFDRKTVLLFQDMFPVKSEHIMGPYIKRNQVVGIYDPQIIDKLERTAEKIIRLLRNGIKFTPTQPDVLRLERRLLEEAELSPGRQTLNELIKDVREQKARPEQPEAKRKGTPEHTRE